MCVSTPKVSAASQVFAASDNGEAIRSADIEARLRKRQAGAAANILTSANGVPSAKLGSAA